MMLGCKWLRIRTVCLAPRGIKMNWILSSYWLPDHSWSPVSNPQEKQSLWTVYIVHNFQAFFFSFYKKNPLRYFSNIEIKRNISKTLKTKKKKHASWSWSMKQNKRHILRFRMFSGGVSVWAKSRAKRGNNTFSCSSFRAWFKLHARFAFESACLESIKTI